MAKVTFPQETKPTPSPFLEPHAELGAHKDALSPSSQKASESITRVALNLLEMPLSGKAISTTYAIGDWTWAVRALTVDLPGSVGVPTAKDSFFYNAIGLTSAFSSFLGMFSAVRAASQLAHSVEIGDDVGAIENGITLCSTTAQTAGGSAMLAYRPLALTASAMGASATSLSAPTLLGRVTYGFGQLANVLFGVFYALLGVLGGWGLYQQIKFRIQYQKAEDKVAFLQEKLSLMPQEHKQILAAQDQQMIKEAKRLLPKASGVKLSKQEWRARFAVAGEEELAKLGRAFQVQKRMLKKEARLRSVAGGACIPMLRALADKDPHAIISSERSALIQKVEKTWARKLLINGLVALFGVAGLATTVAMFLFTAGMGPLIVTSLILLTVLLPMAFVDTYSMCMDLKEGTVGNYDKTYLTFSSVVCALAMTLSITLTAVFSFGILPIALTLLCGGIWLGLNGVAYWYVDEAQKAKRAKGKEENPLKGVVQGWARAERLGHVESNTT